MRKRVTKSSAFELAVYWYEPPTPDEAIRRHWGELIGSAHRLAYLRNELEAVLRLQDLDLALDRLFYHVENYVGRVYEVRERALRLLALVSGRVSDVKTLRKPATRDAAVVTLSATMPTVMRRYLKLQKLIDSDINLRNVHTHETFMQLGIKALGTLYEPDSIFDAMRDRSEPDATRIKRALRLAMRTFVRREVDRTQKIIEAIFDLAESLDPSGRKRPRRVPASFWKAPKRDESSK